MALKVKTGDAQTEGAKTEGALAECTQAVVPWSGIPRHGMPRPGVPSPEGNQCGMLRSLNQRFGDHYSLCIPTPKENPFL